MQKEFEDYEKMLMLIQQDAKDMRERLLLNDLNNINGVSSVFFGPGFITISKLEDIEWEIITQEINNIFDKL